MLSNEFWKKYDSKLKSYINKKVSDNFEAEDIFQEVCYRLIKSENKINEIENVDAWIYRITSNAIIDYYRNKDKFIVTDEVESVSNMYEYSQKIENFNLEAASCLLKLAELLPTKDKEAIIESDYNGIQQNILGVKWGVSHSGAKNRIQRARKKLKEAVNQCCEVKSDHQGNIIELMNKKVTNEEFSCIDC